METLADLQRVLKERVASTMAECESSLEKTIESIEKNIARLEVGTVAAKATTLKTAATVAGLVALKALLLDKAEAEGHMHKDTRVLLIEMVEYIQSTKDKLKERDQAAKVCEAALENKKKTLMQAQAILVQVQAAKRIDNNNAPEEAMMQARAILRMVSDLEDATGGAWRES